MYGVMAFLENELGCRWYTPSVSIIPERKEFSFSWFDHSEQPGVRVRNDFYYEAFDPVWAARNRMNGTMGFRKQPGGVESYWGVHTFYPLMPPEEFFDKHPEYYSLIDGKRVSKQAQLCLTNPDVLKISSQYFTYRRDSFAKVDVVLGDARISMERERSRNESGQFDVLAIDAFSSDAIPVHLLNLP